VFFPEVISQEFSMFVPQDMNGFLFQPSDDGSKRYIWRISNQQMNVILIRFHDIDAEFTVIGFFRKAGFNCIINITFK
jgi:hypothetical protein